MRPHCPTPPACCQGRLRIDIIDDCYARAIDAGALGGKLLGAGNGGFLLFFCEPHLQQRLREALSDLIEVPFSLESEGSKVIFVGGDR